MGNVDNGNGNLFKGTFDGVTVNANAVLVKTTYYGDHDLDGDVDADDYAAIDAGFATNLTGWFNGDNDYSGGKPNSDDYFRVDRSFSGQGSPLGQPETAPAQPSSESVTQPQAPLSATVTASSSTSDTTAIAPGTFASGPTLAVNTATTVAAGTKKNRKHAFEF
jgi:hypothetical protein